MRHTAPCDYEATANRFCRFRPKRNVVVFAVRQNIFSGLSGNTGGSVATDMTRRTRDIAGFPTFQRTWYIIVVRSPSLFSSSIWSSAMFGRGLFDGGGRRRHRRSGGLDNFQSQSFGRFQQFVCERQTVPAIMTATVSWYCRYRSGTGMFPKHLKCFSDLLSV